MRASEKGGSGKGRRGYQVVKGKERAGQEDGRGGQEHRCFGRKREARTGAELITHRAGQTGLPQGPSVSPGTSVGPDH